MAECEISTDLNCCVKGSDNMLMEQVGEWSFSTFGCDHFSVFQNVFPIQEALSSNSG